MSDKVQDALAAALVAMKIASELPGVSQEYDFSYAIEKAEAAYKLLMQRPGVNWPDPLTVSMVKTPAYAEGWNDCLKEAQRSGAFSA